MTYPNVSYSIIRRRRKHTHIELLWLEIVFIEKRLKTLIFYKYTKLDEILSIN